VSATVLLVPGLGNSSDGHWQRQWQRARGFGCIEQEEWDAPRREDWVARIEAVVGATTGPVHLVAHSLGCCTLAHWSQSTRHAARVHGVLLVAPSDVEAPTYPPGTSGFAPMPLARLPFPAVVVASRDDVYVTLARAEAFAAAWGARLVDIGNAGHINVASGHGPWPEGLALLDEALAR
jgi:predicted alpha/beta hydrolase family esterase